MIKSAHKTEPRLLGLYVHKFNFLSYMNRSYDYFDNEVLFVEDTMNFLHRNYNLKLSLFFINMERRVLFEPSSMTIILSDTYIIHKY